MSAVAVLELCGRARAAMRTNIGEAAGLVEIAFVQARQLSDEAPLAEVLRMRGHVAYLGGRYRQAASSYRRAVRILAKLDRQVDVGRTLSSALQSLIYLGSYDEALEWAERARRIFERENDLLRLARLDSNVGNIRHRQDRYVDAIVLYQRAVAHLLPAGDFESAGIALRNMAVCHTELHNFEPALTAYRQAEALYREHGLPLLAAEVDENIAHLHYLRGDYRTAMTLHAETALVPSGNTYHVAVAKLDQSDLFLHLNLFTDAARVSGDAMLRFAGLGMRYERAKAKMNYALALFRLGETKQAFTFLARARRLFAGEANPAWRAATEVCRAIFLFEQGELDKAREAVTGALDEIESTALAARTIQAALLLARIELRTGRIEAARAAFDCAASKRILADTRPAGFQLDVAAGLLAEAEGNPGQAWGHYQAARATLEMLRGQFGGDGLRISFASGKQEVYEHLVRIAVSGSVRVPVAEVVSYVESAKSPALTEAMRVGARAHPTPAVEQLREELVWYYRQLDRAESLRELPLGATLSSLRSRIVACEEQLASEWNRRDGDGAGIGRSEALELGRLQAQLPADGALLEYFTAGRELYLFVVTRTGVHPVALGSLEAVERNCRLLRFQLSRGTLGPHAPGPHDQDWLTATRARLQQLYKQLIAPAAGVLPDGPWVVVPHGILHRVPFHALHDGAGWLIDRRSLSYAPSAAVFSITASEKTIAPGPPAVFAVGDALAPQILAEGRRVTELLPGAQYWEGESATRQQFRHSASTSRLLHVATHGMFRQDNPLFSAILLGDGRLSLYDLLEFECNAALVTCSGCSTGVHESQGAGEIVGLARGLLIAGASAVHLTLWEVNDASAAAYTGAFYESLRTGAAVTEASRQAMLDTRREFSHPFYWAPFAVTGNQKNNYSPIFSGSLANPIGVNSQ